MQLGPQGARFAQGLEDRHQVARRGAHLVHGLHDVVQLDAGLEQEHAVVALGDARCWTRA